MPLFAQYAGPAILSRGEAPSAMTGPQIEFRPFVEVTGIYDTGLAGVAVNDQGQIGNAASGGLRVGWGVSGSHNWRHTELGLDYHGDVNYYSGTTYFDSSDHSLLLGLRHQFSRHVMFSLQTSAGIFSRSDRVLTLSPTVPFDPTQANIPTSDFFDNRTIYATTVADLIYQKSARLSFAFGGGGFLNRRRSAALFGVTSENARADMQYRLTRRTTVGVNYTYSHYGFTRILSSTDLHGVSGSFARQLSQRMEFSGYAGFLRLETKSIQSVPLDPVIAAILGISSGLRIDYNTQYVPNLSARLSLAFNKGVAFIAGGHTVIPGNGLFLTSTSTTATAGYTFTGLRRWSFSASASYNNNNSVANITGNYSGVVGNLAVSRKIARSLHWVANFGARDYRSSTFALYNRNVYHVSTGIGFAPGDVPIRIW